MVTGWRLNFQPRKARNFWLRSAFLQGFVTLKPDTEILYKCYGYYAPECDGAIHFDDLDIGIGWGISSAQAILSEKDAIALFLRDFDSLFISEANK